MVDGTEQLDEIEKQIKGLENSKIELIGRIRFLTRRVRLKKYEQKALVPYLEQTRDVQIRPLRKKRNRIEFMIATAAYTPRLEKQWLKEVRKLDEQLAKVREIEKARRKKILVDQDIVEGEKEIDEIDSGLKNTREKLRKLYDEAKSARMAVKRSTMAAQIAEEDMVALGDLAIIDKRDPKNK
jgi:uncharacterized coiled-coil DUF342 family protein